MQNIIPALRIETIDGQPTLQYREESTLTDAIWRTPRPVTFTPDPVLYLMLPGTNVSKPMANGLAPLLYTAEGVLSHIINYTAMPRNLSLIRGTSTKETMTLDEQRVAVNAAYGLSKEELLAMAGSPAAMQAALSKDLTILSTKALSPLIQALQLEFTDAEREEIGNRQHGVPYTPTVAETRLLAGSTVTRRKWPFNTMQIGQTVSFPPALAKAALNAATSYTQSLQRPNRDGLKKPPKKFVSRTTTGKNGAMIEITRVQP